MAKSAINKEVLREVRLFIKNLKKNNIYIKSAYIFGSHAKGNSNKDSDIDVAVVSYDFGKNRLKEMMFLRKISLKVNSHIEPITFSPSDLADNYSTLSSEVRNFGIRI